MTLVKVEIILNFLHDNEVIKTNLYPCKRILHRLPFMNKVYKISLIKKICIPLYSDIL